MAKIERGMDPEGPKKKKQTEKSSDTKLVAAITGLNNTLDKNFKSIATVLNELNKPKKGRRNNEEISIDRLKVEREKSISAFIEKSQKLQEMALRQRIQYAEENHKRYLEKNYSGDSIGSIPAKVYNNIKGQGSNAGSALALSLMTGGIVSPVIAKELGLDKIVTASAKFAGRTISKATSTAWNMTGGLAWNNLKQPFIDSDSRLRKGLARGSNATSNFFRGGWINSLRNDDSGGGKQTGAVAKDKDKLSKLQKTVEDIKNYITKPKEQVQQQEKEKKKSLLDKLFEAIGGMGLILKGAAVAAIPYVVKEFLPKATEWLDEKFKGFLTGTVGLSEGGAETASQLVKDALPGALFGLTVGGLKGAVVGGLLSLAAINLYRLGEKIGEWVADAVNWVSENPISSLFIGALGIGSFKKIKSAIGKLVPSIKGIGTKLKDITKSIGSRASGWLSDIGKAVKGTLKKIPEAAGKAVESIKNIASKAKDTVVKGAKNATNATKNVAKKAALPIAAALEVGSDVYDIAKSDKPSEVAAKEFLDKKRENGFESKWDYINPYKYGQQFALAIGFDKFVEGVVDKIYPTHKPNIQMKADGQGGGYGTLGAISQNGMLNGTKVTGLKNMGLKGSVVSSNSVPYIASQNEQSLKALDQILSDWGYEVVYTSAMGGHRAYTGHWKGNKVDLQLKKNGRPTRLSSQQLSMLGQAGYWGRGTGALGWEPVSGQVGGGHYDLFIGNGGSGTALASAANIKLKTNDMPTSQETQVFAMNDMAETTQASAESMANSSGSILDMLGNMNDNISNNASSATGGAPTQSLDIPMPQSQNLALSMGSTQGRAGSQTGNVYAFGDVAKTPILYTL